MKKCLFCGKQNNDDTPICVRCRAAFDKEIKVTKPKETKEAVPTEIDTANEEKEVS
jgi:uncharacterized membrane protein YvbJ